MDGKKKIRQKNKKLYSKNLQEDIYRYVFAHKGENLVHRRNSFLKVKRHIYHMRFYGLCKRVKPSFCKKTNKVSLNKRIKNNENHNAIDLKKIIFALSSEVNKKNFTSKSFLPLNNGYLYSSFHLAFTSLERQWFNCYSILQIKMPSSLHPELFIRIVSARIADIAFIDLLRRHIHMTRLNLFSPTYSKHTIDIDVTPSLINIWSWEVESYVQSELYVLLQKFSQYSPRQVSFSRKKYYTNNFYKPKHISISSFSQKRNYTMNIVNYLRYANYWILGLDTELLILEKLKRRCIRFLRHRMGISVTSFTWNAMNVYGKYCSFLGSKFTIKSEQLKLQMVTSSFLMLPHSFFIRKMTLIIIPISKLLKVLFQYGICKKNGYPISKASWSTCPDLLIIQRFSHILIQIHLYYSGCANRNKLAYIHYIIAYSCAKTLACKHKSNVRSIWYNYTRDFVHYDLFFKKASSVSLEDIKQINQVSIRQHPIIWDLSKKHIEPIICSFVEETYN